MNNAGKALNLFAEDRIAARLTATSDFDLMDVHRSVMSVYVMEHPIHVPIQWSLLVIFVE